MGKVWQIWGTIQNSLLILAAMCYIPCSINNLLRCSWRDDFNTEVCNSEQASAKTNCNIYSSAKCLLLVIKGGRGYDTNSTLLHTFHTTYIEKILNSSYVFSGVFLLNPKEFQPLQHRANCIHHCRASEHKRTFAFETWFRMVEEDDNWSKVMGPKITSLHFDQFQVVLGISASK